MKVGVVGAGFVGAASAYAMAIRGSASELVLIDVNAAKAEAEARDIAHATTFTAPVRVSHGTYESLGDAKVVVMSAGVNQRPGESRMELLGRNAAIFRIVIPQIVTNAPGAIILVSANPVDIMTELTERIAYAAGGRPGSVLGTGTVLDTARFRSLVGTHLGVDARHAHGYVFGEHGDSEVLGWSSLDIAGLPVEEFARTKGVVLERRGQGSNDRRDRARGIRDHRGQGGDLLRHRRVRRPAWSRRWCATSAGSTPSRRRSRSTAARWPSHGC